MRGGARANAAVTENKKGGPKPAFPILDYWLAD